MNGVMVLNQYSPNRGMDFWKTPAGKQASQPRVIMLVDLDYFFAQCEEVRNPSFKNKPVVVCVYSGRSEESGVVSTANYVARKYGVKSGIPISVAKKKLGNTGAVFLPVDHDYYDTVSGKVMKILKNYADVFEQAGIDEAYLDVSMRVEKDFDKARELAQRIKEDLKASQKITCSIGVGPNKLVAKIAADFKKPDGLTLVKPEKVEEFLSPLPVNRLIGIGVKTESIMKSLGVETIGDLARYDVQELIRFFGVKLGAYFHNASRGIDDSPVKEYRETASLSRISTLKEDTRDLEPIVKKINELCGEIHAELAQQKWRFKQVGVIAVMKDISVRSRSRTLEKPTNDLDVLKKSVKELFEKLLKESDLEVRRVGVKVSGFTKDNNLQKQLSSFTRG
ncbi:MAG: DNA polymerase IV [Thermoproteota archaeon]